MAALSPDPGKNRGGYTQKRGLCGPRYRSGFSAKKDLLLLLENEGGFVSVSANTLTIMPKV